MATVTIKAARAAHPLAAAVLRQLGGGRDAVESAKDAARHGADGGFHGFIRYTDTAGFARRNRRKIADAVSEMAADLGVSSDVSLVRGFRCLEGADVSERDIAAALWGGPPESEDGLRLVSNALAWFALEEVGHALANLTA